MKILLVEDEPPILRDLEMQIQHYKDCPLSVFTARHGRQALEILEKSEAGFDLLITDIEMPVMNGLELIAHAKLLNPDITCVILTGYSDFEYAKQAIHLGVFEYLLKPVAETSLYKLLGDVIRKKHHLYLAQSMKNPSSAVLPITDCYFIAIISLGTFSMQSHEYNIKHARQWQQLDLENKLGHGKRKYTDFLLIEGKSNSEKNLIINLKHQNTTVFSQYLLSLCSGLTVPVTIAYHKNNIPISGVSQSFQQLRSLLSRKVIIGKSLLIPYDDSETVFSDQLSEKLKQILINLTQLFSNLQIKSFEAQFLVLIQTLSQTDFTQYYVFHCFHKLITDCLDAHHLRNELYFDMVDCIWDSIALSDSYMELYENMLSVFRDLFEQIGNRQENSVTKEQLMIMIDTYIKEHYHQAVNAQTLAEEFHFTPAYLSKLFREYQNMSPTDYITELRISKAKELLLSSHNIKIRDVSALVGYEDPLYFSKVFKKVTNQTPRQYLSDIQKDKN